MMITKNAVLTRTISLVAGVLFCGALAVNASAEAFPSSPKSISLSYSSTQHDYLARNSLKSIFQKDSYWKMTQYNYGSDSDIRGEYFVHLGNDTFHDFQIVSAEADDLLYDSGNWGYDDRTATLEIGTLNDGYSNHIFNHQNGIFVCEGTYYRTELVRTSTAEREFNSALKSFNAKYGSYNPAKRLVTTNSHFRYVAINEIETLSGDAFRNMVNNKSFGLVLPMEASRAEKLSKAFALLLGKKMAETVQNLSVLSGVNIPYQENLPWTCSGSVEITNLVYKPYDEALTAFETLTKAFSDSLPSSTYSMNMTANSLYQEFLFWNDTEALAIVQYGGSLLIFHGPTSDIKTMSEFLSIGDYLW